MKYFLRILFLALCPAIAMAQPVAEPSPKTVLAAVALNSALSERTTEVYSVSGYSGLKINVVGVRTAYTDMSLLCYESDDYSAQAAASAVWYSIMKVDSGDAATVFNPKYTVSASANWGVILEVGGMKYIYCTIAATSAGANDTGAITFKKTRGY